MLSWNTKNHLLLAIRVKRRSRLLYHPLYFIYFRGATVKAIIQFVGFVSVQALQSLMFPVLLRFSFIIVDIHSEAGYFIESYHDFSKTRWGRSREH